LLIAVLAVSICLGVYHYAYRPKVVEPVTIKFVTDSGGSLPLYLDGKLLGEMPLVLKTTDVEAALRPNVHFKPGLEKT